jgi:hypothetical protein
MDKRRKRKIDWNGRIDWFDDWREWFGPKGYGTGMAVKSWKGVAAIGLVIFLIVIITMGVAKILTWI